MGWRGFRSKIDGGMLFKKMYCKNCGTRLKIKKNSQVVEKGDDGFTPRGTIGMTSYYSIDHTYYCPNCFLVISYDDQCVVAQKQKYHKKKILAEDENIPLKVQIRNLVRKNWILLIVGVVIALLMLTAAWLFFVNDFDIQLPKCLLVLTPFVVGIGSIAPIRENCKKIKRLKSEADQQNTL